MLYSAVFRTIPQKAADFCCTTPISLELDLKMPYYFDDQRTFRERAGVTRSLLAREADVDRGTVTRSEKHHPCTKESLVRIINGLNKLYYQNNGTGIDPDKVLSERSRYGNR